MTDAQHAALAQVRRSGYVCEVDRNENNGIVRVSVVRRWRQGVFSILIRPDGTYRGGHYQRWDKQIGSVARWQTWK